MNIKMITKYAVAESRHQWRCCQGYLPFKAANILKVSLSQICLNPVFRRCCRFGFVEFEDQETAEKAKADKDGLEIQGREVQLAFANDKPGGMSGATARGSVCWCGLIT